MNVEMEMDKCTRTYAYKGGLNKRKLCENLTEYQLRESEPNEKNAIITGKKSACKRK